MCVSTSGRVTTTLAAFSPRAANLIGTQTVRHIGARTRTDTRTRAVMRLKRIGRVYTDLATWKVWWTAGPAAPSNRAGRAAQLSGGSTIGATGQQTSPTGRVTCTPESPSTRHGSVRGTRSNTKSSTHLAPFLVLPFSLKPTLSLKPNLNAQKLGLLLYYWYYWIDQFVDLKKSLGCPWLNRRVMEGTRQAAAWLLDVPYYPPL